MTSATRAVGPFQVSPIGLGCMGLSHGYGPATPRAASGDLLRAALDLGCTFFDTASIYGLGHNEGLVGEFLSSDRERFTLASKCGLFATPDGKRGIDGSPAKIKATCDESLTRLKTDVIDLYYLHRIDRAVPIEESVGALKDLIDAGKIRAIGLSEMSAATLRRAHAVHPIAAMQTEYSPWTRNPEVAVLDACAELGTAFVAFSPVARGFLANGVRDMAVLDKGDMRLGMPRFLGEHFTANLKLLDAFTALGQAHGCTPAQLCLAWLLAKAPHIVPIPGTTRLDHLREDFAAWDIALSPEAVAAVDDLVNPGTVSGARYSPAMQASIDTEEIAA
ncbi:Aldo-keto reductase IolS [Alphaproteobacteria bacterium SO-S41]|nr:Aldo-keto reductase IolS [Alphaproteobacteria bacterium SO-S41]